MKFQGFHKFRWAEDTEVSNLIQKADGVLRGLVGTRGSSAFEGGIGTLELPALRKRRSVALDVLGPSSKTREQASWKIRELSEVVWSALLCVRL